MGVGCKPYILSYHTYYSSPIQPKSLGLYIQIYTDLLCPIIKLSVSPKSDILSQSGNVGQVNPPEWLETERLSHPTTFCCMGKSLNNMQNYNSWV